MYQRYTKTLYGLYTTYVIMFMWYRLDLDVSGIRLLLLCLRSILGIYALCASKRDFAFVKIRRVLLLFQMKFFPEASFFDSRNKNLIPIFKFSSVFSTWCFKYSLDINCDTTRFVENNCCFCFHFYFHVGTLRIKCKCIRLQLAIEYSEIAFVCNREI